MAAVIARAPICRLRSFRAARVIEIMQPPSDQILFVAHRLYPAAAHHPHLALDADSHRDNQDRRVAVAEDSGLGGELRDI